MFSIPISSSKCDVVGSGGKVAGPARHIVGVPIPVRVVNRVVADSIASFGQLLKISLPGPLPEQRQGVVLFDAPIDVSLRAQGAERRLGPAPQSRHLIVVRVRSAKIRAEHTLKNIADADALVASPFVPHAHSPFKVPPV